MSADITFTKGSLDSCLRQLAKEFRRLNGTVMPAEIILIGGAAILANYGFREATYDVDAIVRASSAMKEAINRVGDANGLPHGWLNSDFMSTKSYSPKLVQVSRYYKTYSNVLTVRTVSGEYLIAMKLASGRGYKNDLSDTIGIFREEKEMGTPITYARLDKAVCELYGGWEQLPKNAKSFAQEVMECTDLDGLYDKYRSHEAQAKRDLVEFEARYPKVLREDNADDIIATLQSKKSRDDLER